MLKYILVVTFYCLTNIKYSQMDEYNYGSSLFFEETEIKNSPSINAETIGLLTKKSLYQINNSTNYKLDTVNGVVNYWIPVIFNDTKGYIWGGDYTLSSYRSTIDISHLVNFHYGNKTLTFSIEDSIQTRYRISFNSKNKSQAISSCSFGKTYNSKNNEVLGVLFEDGNYELYEWNGKKIKESRLKLREDSFITKQYATFPYSIISETNINFRSQPKIESQKISSLGQNTMVTLLEEQSQKDTINGVIGYWSKISYQNDTGYVWHSYLSNPIRYIRSNKNENIDFLQTSNAIYVISNGSVISKVKAPFSYHATYFFDKGTLGLSDQYQFLAIYILGHGCGTDSGDQLYVWDGKEIKYFGYQYGIGDGSLSESHSLAFPINTGIKDVIFKEDLNGESVDTPIKNGNDGYEFIYDNYSASKLQYNGDTLIEIDSKDMKLRKAVTSNYPKYVLKNYKFGDLNNDGIEDAVFLIRKEDYNYNWEPKDPVIGITYGSRRNGFLITKSNSKLIHTPYTGVSFNCSNGSLDLTIYYNSGYDASEYLLPHQQSFKFQFNTEKQQLLWLSKSVSYLNQLYSNNWETETLHYKTNKILFKDAWTESIDD